MDKINKVVLAYSGGLDTSVILRWLKETYQCEVATFTANLGQDEEYDLVKSKAEKQGSKEIFIEDLKEEFVSDYVFPMFRANPLYEGYYLLGTSIARPLIAKKQIEIANQIKADAVSHGATGKGNDQIRFELGYYYHKPDIKIISPWREWELSSRTSREIVYSPDSDQKTSISEILPLSCTCQATELSSMLIELQVHAKSSISLGES